MLLVQKHLGFTKSCQHLKPQQSRPEGCLRVNQKPKANVKEICGESGLECLRAALCLAVTGEKVISHSMAFSWVGP